MIRSLVIRIEDGQIQDILTDSPEILALMSAGNLDVLLANFDADRFDVTYPLQKPGSTAIGSASIETFPGRQLILYTPEMVNAIRSTEPNKESRP